MQRHTILVMLAYAPLSSLIASAAARAEDAVVATCTMRLESKVVWNSKCCVKATAEPESLTASLHAESWKACQFAKKNPTNAALPTYKQNCIGPWINITEEFEGDRRSFTAYWSIEGACHGDAPVPARMVDPTTFRGDTFTFQWRRS